MFRSLLSVRIHNLGSFDVLTEKPFLAIQKSTTDNYLCKPFYEIKLILFSTLKILESWTEKR